MGRYKNQLYDVGETMFGDHRQDDCWTRLATAIIRQAYSDYYKDCIPYSQIKCNPKGRGRWSKTENEPSYWRTQRETDRELRKQEEIAFFHSDWFATLSTMRDLTIIKDILNKIEEKRENGYPLFDRTDMDEEEKEIYYGYSSSDFR